MKIKVAILENDENYLSRISAVFSSKYADRLEVYSFTESDKALDNIEHNGIDILLADESYEVTSKDVPNSCGFAYLVKASDIELLRNEKTIAKFQMVDLIYKQILSIFSEKTAEITSVHFDNTSGTKLLSYIAASGGVGSSTIAAAAAIRLAAQGRDVLYLNLEQFGSSDEFFSAEGALGFSDIIYALKGKNTNVQLKIESAVKQDACGVQFFSGTKTALDMTELNSEDMEELIMTLKQTGDYEYIVIDLNFSFEETCLIVLNESDTITLVSDGTQIANNKTVRVLNSLKILDQQNKRDIYYRTSVLYNKFKSTSIQILEDIEVRVHGGIPKYESSSTQQLLQQISTMPVLEETYHN